VGLDHDRPVHAPAAGRHGADRSFALFRRHGKRHVCKREFIVMEAAIRLVFLLNYAESSQGCGTQEEYQTSNHVFTSAFSTRRQTESSKNIGVKLVCASPIAGRTAAINATIGAGVQTMA
jgi:hypothetical protein